MAITTNQQPVSIRLENIVKRFEHNVKGSVSAVDHVSLTVAPGELLTLLGPSGCGKTTTLRMIAGFEHPTEGTIHIGKQDVTHLRANERNIGFVFQNYAIFPHLSVFENVAYGLRVKGTAQADITKAVDNVLELVGLGGYGGQQPHQLSGGEQQRVALARAIVFQPRILMFDEPLSNLDAKLRTQMRGEIRDLQKRLGITAVYVTHDQEEAMAISDRIAVMSRGKVVQMGTAETLYAQPCNAFMANFIGKANLFRGRVVQTDGTAAHVDVFGQTLHCLLPDGVSVSKDQDVAVVVRPEQIAIGRDVADGTAVRIVKRTFLGEKTEYLFTLGQDTFQACVFGKAALTSFSEGETVQMRLPPEGNHLISD
jgi:iron(III) transport system ATP-binding protein